MSGHSHWSTIKRQKQTADKKRGQIFSKIARELQVAARQGTDPELNPRLQSALEKAKKLNVPQGSIQRAIDKAAGVGETSGLEEVVLEGYGPEGVAIMLKAATDNRNRTIAQLRRIFNEHRGSLGERGSAAYIFRENPEKPAFTAPVTNQKKADQVLSLLKSLRDHDDVLEVWSNAQFIS